MTTHSTRRTACRLLALATLLPLLATGCADPDFEQFWEVRKLRTFAVIADPPELGPQESMQLRAESFSPEGDVTHRWTLCLAIGSARDGYPCEDVVDGFESFDLGEGDTVELVNPLSAEQVTEVCDQLEQFLGRPCVLGIPVFVRLVATDGIDELVSLRTVLLLTEEAAAREDRNESPRIAGLTWNGAPLRAGELTEVELDAESEARLQIAVSEESGQQYVDPVTGEEEEERLTATWFTTSGSIEFPRTFFGPRAPLVELQRNTLSSTTARPIESGDAVTLFVVLRDNRGGVSSIRRDVLIR